METIGKLLDGTCPRTPQDESNMSYYPMLTKQMGLMDWSKSAHGQLSAGLIPGPAYTPSPHGTLKVLSARAEEASGAPGMVLEVSAVCWWLAARGHCAFNRCKLPGGRAMAAHDYLRGHPMDKGSRMTEE